jgi:hypothetical protein
VLAIASVPLAACFGIGGLFGIAAIVLSRPGLRSKDNYGKALTGFVVGCDDTPITGQSYGGPVDSTGTTLWPLGPALTGQ